MHMHVSNSNAATNVMWYSIIIPIIFLVLLFLFKDNYLDSVQQDSLEHWSESVGLLNTVGECQKYGRDFYVWCSIDNGLTVRYLRCDTALPLYLLGLNTCSEIANFPKLVEKL